MNRYNRRYIAAPDMGSPCRSNFDGSTLLRLTSQMSAEPLPASQIASKAGVGIGRATLLLTVAANRGIVQTEYRRLKRGGAPLALYALKPKAEVVT